MDRASRKQRQLDRKYDSIRRYAAQEEKYSTTTSTSKSDSLSHLSLTHQTTRATSSSSVEQAGHRSGSAEQRTSSSVAMADTRSVSADPIKRYHADQSGGGIIRSYPVVVAIQDYVPEPGVAPEEALPLEQGQIVEVLDNKNPANWLVRTKAKPPRTGWVPGSYFETPSKYYTQRRTTRELMGAGEGMDEQQQALLKREQVYTDLLRTEEEFTSELRVAIDNYVKAIDSEEAPDDVQEQRHKLVMNIPELHNFHANVLLKGLQYYSDDPGKVGQTFVRLERDFEQHVAFMRELDSTLRMVQEVHAIKQYLEQVKSKSPALLKSYSEYLLLIPTRVGQYESFFKEIIKYSTRAQQNTDVMQKALELVQSMPKRAQELEFTKNILNFPGDTRRLGRIYRHELFQVWEGDDSDPSEKYVFLFKNKMMLTDRDNKPDPPLFKHYSTIRVDKYTVRQHTVEPDTIVCRPNEPGLPSFRMKAKDAQLEEIVRKAWLKDILEMQQAIGPEEGPPRKKVKSPPCISPTGSSTSLYSGGSSSIEWQTTGTSLEMQGTRVTRTQYGFRTLQESSAKMCLKVTGFPLPDITWYKDSVLVKEDERHTFYSDEDGFFALTIDPVKTDDTGRYTCVATNEYGQASTSAFFRVLKVEKESAPPSFKQPLKDMHSKEGDVVDFECEVDGWPEPELVWLQDDQPLRPSHDFRIQYDGQHAKLEIRDAQPDDTGTYAVKITNEYGTAESKCQLNVQPDPDKNHVPPEFQAVIEDVECNEGDTVKFKAILTGDPDPEVVWYVNGVPLTQSEKIKFISEDGICILTIQDVSRHFDGTVTCQGKNRLGSGSCEARLRVRVPPVPPQFERPLEDRIITENGAVMFEVDVIGYPEPKVEFYLKGRPLVHGLDGVDIRQLEGNYRVTIQNCQIDKHDGEVMARAMNEHGQAESRARLTVEPEEEESRSAPTFIKDIEDQTVKHGQEAVFDTIVRGSPMPSVNWFINGQMLDAQTPGVISIHANGTEHKIVLDSTHWAGTVLCRAENTIGRFETKARLIVLPAEKRKQPPVFRQPLLDKAETEGNSVVFEVTVDAEPPAQFRWTLNGQELRPTDRIHLREFEGSSKLELDECRFEDAGQIECTAVNSEGQAQTSAKFNVNRKPKAPQFDKRPGTVQVEKGEQAVLEAHADAVPMAEYQWSIGGRRVFPSTDGARVELDEQTGTSRLIIDTNKFPDSAQIVVNAANQLGTDECSARLIVVEPLPGPPFKKGRYTSEDEESESQLTQVQNLPGQEAAKLGEQMGQGLGMAEPMEGVEVQQGAVGQPKFNKGLEQVLECKPGEDLVAEVRVDGAQKVKWSKNGEPLEDGKNGVKIDENLPEGYSRLHIPNIQPGQNGRLKVEAENENGQVTSEGQIRIAPSVPGAPQFQQPLQNASVNEGEPVEFSTVVTGEPAPNVKWLINDKEVEMGDENIQVSQQPGGVHTLRIGQANPAKHSGRILAQAENAQGRAESAADIAVKSKPGPPYFSREPQDHEVTDEVESVKFSAIVHGEPVPTVFWYLKDQLLVTSETVRIKHEPGTGKTSIRMIRPKIEDSGEVRCRAENVHGQAQASANLKVEKKGEVPRFLTDMVDKQVNEGSNVKFVAKIEAIPEPEIQWTLNGEPISGDNVRITSDGITHTLEINGVTPQQQGEIACTAKNSAGSKRQNVQLMVKHVGIGPTFVRNLQDCLVEEHQTLIMEAHLAPGIKPKPTVKWLRDGKELVSDDHTKLTEDADGTVHKLTIIRTEASDKGRITVQAENQFGKAETSASVGVQKRFSQKKPQFLSELGPITITEGDTLTAKVIISGDPTPYTKWYINNQMVYQTEDTEMKNEAGVYTLVIHGCTRDMTGKIRCVAGNKMGEAQIEGKLTVVAPVPVEFETGLCDATCREGDTLRLKAVLLGEPMPEVTWFINGKKLVESQNIKIHADQGTYTVTIKDITQDYSGLVVCEAVNEFGKASSQATLKVLPRGEPPDFLEWLSNVRARQGSEVIHKVVYTGDPRPVISWFINSQQVQSSDEISIVTTDTTSTLTIKSFNPEKHVGEIICKAENDAGEVSCTANMASYTSDMFTESESGSQVDEEHQETFRTPTPIMAPAFITKIKDTRAQRGHQAIFECVVPDTKGVCCKWLHDGKEIELIARIRVQVQTIEGFTTSELVIDEVEPEDAGKYTVIVENEAGQAQCEAKLEVVETLDKPVQKAPEFTVLLQDKSVPLAEKVTFECKVTGLPEPRITWFKGDEQLEPSPDGAVRIDNEKGVQRLTIESVANEHEGRYMCVAENMVGKAETAANLKVETLAPEFTRPLSDQEAQLCGQVVFECSVRGIPQPNVEFFTVHDNFRIQTGTRVSIQHDATNTHWRMVIKDVQQNDFREYRAVAKNDLGQAQCEAKLTQQESGLERPRIIEPLKRQKVKEGETVEMGVKVAGAGKPGQPPPEVEWFKNGQPLQPDGDRVKLVEYRDTGEFKLIIRDARAEDAGEFGIRVSNKAGQDSSQAQLAVEVEPMQKPEFTQPLRDTNIKEKESATMSVAVTGIPQPEVQWFKDGNPVLIDGVHVVRQDDHEAGKHSLVINEARLEDAGLYSCKAVNKAGEAESRARFGVQEDLEPPRFTEGLKPVQIKETESATMSVTVEGKPLPEVHWYKDGRPVQIDQARIFTKQEQHGQAARHSLTVQDALLVDAGQYSCKAINKAGQAETEAKFGVQEQLEAPKFTEGLKPVEVKEGETATMSVTVTGKPEPEIQWYKDGHPVEIDGVHIARQDDAQGHHSLVVKDAKLRDAGSFTCQAKNKAGQCVTQAKFGVQEDVELPKFTDGLKPVEVKEGETATMSVTVEGKPEPQVHWYKDGRPVQIDNVHVVAQDDGHGHHSLTIKDATLGDAGQYTCKAVNKAGTAESDAKFGIIEELKEPKFIDGLKPLEIKEGESAKMSVEVEGKPEPEVSWFKDGQPVQLDNVHVLAKEEGKGQHSLTVKDANLADAGTYSAKAVNKVGQAETQAKFGVIEDLQPPDFTKGLSPVEINEGETATMAVEVEGKPLPQVQWFKDGQPVQIDNVHIVAQDDGHGHHSLTVKDAKLADAGTYSCKAVNKAGSAETRANFAVIEEVEAPKFTEGLKPVEVKEGETAKMSVEVEGKPEPEVSWYKDDRPVQLDNVHVIAKEEGRGKHSLTVKDANLADAGTYSAKAVNKAGQAETKANFGVMEEVEIPKFTDGLKPVEVKEGETATMSVTVEGKPEPQIQWYKDGRPVQIDKVHVVTQDDGNGHHSLTIKDALLTDAGQYTCKAVNKAGTAESEAKFGVIKDIEQPEQGQTQPMFIRPLEPKTVREGEPVELSCQVNAKESRPDIRWFRDDHPIQPGQEPNIQLEQSEDGTLRLKILHATKAEIGTYRCEAVNPVGKAETSAPLKYAEQLPVEQPEEEHEALLAWRRLLQDKQEPKGAKGVQLECQLEPGALKGVRVDWLKDGAILSNKMEQYRLHVEQLPDGTQRLLFDCAEFEHIGVYRCVATDAGGNQIWTEARLGVIAPRDTVEVPPGPPEFVELLKSATTTIGGTAVLRCKVKGNPRPTIVWSRQGYGPITMSDRLSLEYHEDGTIILTLKDAEMEDTGEYRCDAENEYGTAWTEGPIIVAAEGSLPTEGEAPDFVEPVRPITVKQGETGVLEGKITGLPFPEVKWYKGEEPIVPGANPRYKIESLPDGTQRLIVSNAQLSDMDDYRCEASNKYGDVWSDVTLTVQIPSPEESLAGAAVPPSFVKPLQEVLANEDAPAVLECVVKGEPMPQLKWFKDGQEIEPDNMHFKQTLQPDGTARLSIPLARITDAGTFRCEATNPAGSARTEAPLRVLLAEEAPELPEIPMETAPEFTAPQFLQGLKPVQAKEGDEAVFECKVAGEPKPDLKWYKDGKELGPEDGVLIESLPDGTQRLHVPNVGPDDEGNFECVATNPAGTVRSQAPLSVVPAEKAPTFKKGLEDQNLPKGAKLVMEVEVDGQPKTVKWFRDGKPLDESSGAIPEDLGNGRFRLTIPELKDDGDFGRYSVQVANDAGTAESAAAVTEAVAKPEIVKGLQPVTVRPGEPAQFEVQVRGPVRTVKWYKNGREMENPQTEQDGQGCFRLIIPSAGPDDEAEYKVVVANPAGEADSSAPLTLLTPLGFVRPLEDQTVPKGQKAVLEVETNRAPRVVKWYKNGEELKPGEAKAQPKQVSDTMFRLEIPDTDAEDSANYSVRVFDREDEPGAECSCALKVLLPAEPKAEQPGFEQPLREQTIPEEDELVLEVKTHGKPHTVKWYKNGNELLPSDRIKMEQLGPDHFRLIIPTALADDSGNYAVEIINNAGKAKCDAQQTVEPFPEFIRPLQDVEVEEGERAEFWCETNLRSVPRLVKWFKNGQELAQSDRLEMRVEAANGIFRLVIPSARMDDIGTYKILLENTAGRNESSAQLGVRSAKKLEPPKIVKALLDQIVAEGDELVFEVGIQGDVDEIKWLKDGFPLGKDARIKAEKVDDQTYRLTIPNAVLADAGEFEVQASNAAGKAVSSAHAEVDQAPRIVQGLIPAEIDEGDEHLFRVEASAPIRTVKWFKNGEEIKAPPGARIRLKDVSPKKYELEIDNAQLDDGATYRVVLANKAGQCESQAELKVRKPEVFKLRKGLEDVTIDEGQPLELVAELDGVPAKVIWLKNGVEVVPDERIKISANPETGVYSLQIPQAVAADGGAYRVVFANPKGGEVSSGSVAHVRAKKPSAETSPAIFLTPLEDVELPEGDTLNLKCKVGGLPLPEVKWFRNGEELKPDDRIAARLGLDGTATLRIRDVRKGEDAGQFKAVATNEAGQAETQCQVRVIGAEEQPCPPKFVIPLKRTEALPGANVEFNVKVRGVPAPTLEWILNGTPIDFATSPRFQLEDMSDGHWTMTIRDVQEADFGTLRCVARNPHGQDQCEAPFEPSAEKPAKEKAEPEGYPPRFNVPLWDRRVPEGPPMSIECHVDAKPTAEIEWFFKGQPLKESDEIEIRNTPDGACRVRIRNFRKEHVGDYRCEAKNPYGVADTRANYNVEQPEEEAPEEKRENPPKFNPGLSDQSLNVGDTLKLYCRVEAVPAAAITFYKDGVPIRATERIQVDYDVDSGECNLTIADCTPEDAGAYRCVAQNIHGSTNTACQVSVKAKKEEAKREGAEPFFTRGLVDQYVDKGAPMTFTCAVTGDPEPEIKWFRNGIPLKSTGRIQIEQLPGGECRLTIQDCSMSDEGIYRCEATNPLGTAKTQATGHVEVSKKLEKPKLDMGEAPRFIIPLEDATRMVGSTIELECKCTGVPMPSVKWAKDGRPLLEDGRFEWENRPEQGHYRLRIREAGRHDEGTYRCVATNDSGQASTKAFVRVDEGVETRAPPAEQAHPPRISVKLADQRVMEGQPLKLHCKVEGDPTPEIVWYKDGEQVRPSERIQLERDADGNAYLIIPKCTMDDDGVYRVIATNPHGSAYDKCTVTVKKAAADEGPPAPEGVEFDSTRAPRLLEPLQNVKVNEKEPIKLRCRFGWRSGDPKPTIKWYKDGDRLFPYDHVEIPEMTDDGYCELNIPESVRSDAGNYRCVAENQFGSARTACEVQVQRDKKPRDLEQELKDMGRAPGFTIPLTVKHAKPGDRVVFECLPYGKPFPEIKWLKDGMELVPGEGLKIEADPDGTQRLILENVDFPSEGFFRCVATNEHGTASTRAELKLHGERPLPKRPEEAEGPPVESKPRIRPGLYNQSIHQGSPVEMQIAALGFPTPTVEWLKDGKPIQAAGTPDSRVTIFQDDRGLHHLVIVNVQPEDEGDYSVVAKNPLGEAVSTGTLNVIRPRGVEGAEDEGRGGMPFPPGFIRQLKNKHVFSKMPTIFDCLVVGYPPPEVDWYHNGKKIVPSERIKIQVAGGGSHALLIQDTCVEDAGEYVAIARNCHGQAQSSAILDVTVPFLDKIKFDGTEDVTPYLTEEYGFKKQKYKSIPTPPDRGPFIKEVTGHYLTLSWIPTKRSPPRYPQVTYVIEFRELPDRDWQLLDYNIPEPVCKVRNLELGKSYQFRVRAENIYGISDPSPPSPPSRLMASPPPVLDKNRRVIPLLDPYAERALELAHAEQYACTPWFAPGVQEKRYVAESDHMSITLHYSGYPDPKITWKHRGWDVDANSPTSNIRVSTHAGTETSITFLGFTKANAGQYTCVAENQYGKAEQNLLIDVATRPKFAQGLSNRAFPSDRPLRLDVRVEGNPMPDVKWMKDWRPMAESSRVHFLAEPGQRSLLIDQPIWSDSGIYSCIALNDAGQAVTSCTITIEAENDFLKDLKLREIRKAIKLERGPLRNIYDIAEAEEEEYSVAESIKNGNGGVNGTTEAIKNGV